MGRPYLAYLLMICFWFPREDHGHDVDHVREMGVLNTELVVVGSSKVDGCPFQSCKVTYPTPSNMRITKDPHVGPLIYTPPHPLCPLFDRVPAIECDHVGWNGKRRLARS